MRPSETGVANAIRPEVMHGSRLKTTAATRGYAKLRRSIKPGSDVADARVVGSVSAGSAPCELASTRSPNRLAKGRAGDMLNREPSETMTRSFPEYRCTLLFSGGGESPTRWTIPALALLLILGLYPTSADELSITTVELPELRIQGQPAQAHTQGLEIVSSNYYVTARRDDVQPRRALLLRTAEGRTDWDVWDITPVDEPGRVMDHPGGLQSDGMRLWIPVAESKRGGKTSIRRYALEGIIPGRPLKPDFEFTVNDHVGALAVLAERKSLLGASWDTEKVYVWEFDGRAQQGLSVSELALRSLGADASGAAGNNRRAGLTVQDWKIVDGRLFASGLMKGPNLNAASPQSRLMIFTEFLANRFQRVSIPLPRQRGTELAREAMSISKGQVYFLADDLGAPNRLYRVPLADLVKNATQSE